MLIIFIAISFQIMLPQGGNNSCQLLLQKLCRASTCFNIYSSPLQSTRKRNGAAVGYKPHSNPCKGNLTFELGPVPLPSNYGTGFYTHLSHIGCQSCLAESSAGLKASLPAGWAFRQKTYDFKLLLCFLPAPPSSVYASKRGTSGPSLR